MSLQIAAKHLASHGRGPDTELIHMTKGEIKSLQQLAMASGGSLTINPHTGLAEAGFLSKMLPMVVGAAAMYFSGGTAAPLIAGMSNAATIGLGMGAFETARTGSIQKGLMAGLGAYGGAGLAGGLMGAGASAMNTTAANATQTANPQLMASEVGREMGTAGFVQPEIAANMNPATASAADKMTLGASNLGNGAFTQQMGGGSGLFKTGLAAAAPLMAGEDKKPEAPVGDADMGQRYSYSPGRPVATLGQAITPMPDVPGYGYQDQNFGKQQRYFSPSYNKLNTEQAKTLYGYADGGMPTSGGPVEAMSNANAIGANTGYPMANVNQAAYATPFHTPVSQNVVQGTADTGVNSMTGEMNEFANGGVTGYADGGYTFDPKTQTFSGGPQAQQAQPQGAGQPQQGYTFDPKTRTFSGAGTTANYLGGGQYGPTAEQLAAAAALSNIGYDSGGGGGGSGDGGGEANGGLMAAYAAGGMSHLGDYSDGGRLLKGPGDGVSDSIPATIGNKRPARLADGEFVVPARIVSELGNGSTEAGARKLYAMLDRVQSARKKSIGKGKVAKNSRADNLLPA